MTRKIVAVRPATVFAERQIAPEREGFQASIPELDEVAASSPSDSYQQLAIAPPAPTLLPDGSTNLVSADLLIPGRSEPLHNHTVITQLGKIMAVLPTSHIPDPFKSLPSTTVPVLLPGLWDCHSHLLGHDSFQFATLLTTPPALAGARLATSLSAILDSGFTSVRDLGSHALEVRPAVEEGTIRGPHIYGAGAAISQTAGHGDAFDLPSGWVNSRQGVSDASNNYAPGTSCLCIADGVDEVRKAVRLQIRRGAHVIKLFASGGVLSIADDPLRQQFSDAELSTIVEEAERQGRVVAAHVHGKVAILAALKAGVKTIEHGTYMDDECIKLFKENNAIYVPTRTIVKLGVDHPELMDPKSYKKMLETAKHHLSAYRLAVKHNLRIALGTDLGISVPVDHPMALGNSGQELVYAVTDAGMTPLQAIEAATSMGPEALGDLGMKPKSGRIEEGYDADMIALKSDPLKDIEVFRKSENVSHVWKMGALMKSPGEQLVYRQ